MNSMTRAALNGLEEAVGILENPEEMADFLAAPEGVRNLMTWALRRALMRLEEAILYPPAPTPPQLEPVPVSYTTGESSVEDEDIPF